jgi:hypothetical protein
MNSAAVMYAGTVLLRRCGAVWASGQCAGYGCGAALGDDGQASPAWGQASRGGGQASPPGGGAP